MVEKSQRMPLQLTLSHDIQSSNFAFMAGAAKPRDQLRTKLFVTPEQGQSDQKQLSVWQYCRIPFANRLI